MEGFILNHLTRRNFAKSVITSLAAIGCSKSQAIALQKQSNGNGIENIKKRVARNQGIVTFEQNALATGLQVSISIPLK